MKKICLVSELPVRLGVPALIGDASQNEQIAIFKLNDDQIYAVSNFDPFSQTNTIDRGLTGELRGHFVVACPIYKQHFDLTTGVCLEDETVSIKTYPIEVVEGAVYLV